MKNTPVFSLKINFFIIYVTCTQFSMAVQKKDDPQMGRQQVSRRKNLFDASSTGLLNLRLNEQN
jgi:hypothetical protein